MSERRHFRLSRAPIASLALFVACVVGPAVAAGADDPPPAPPRPDAELKVLDRMVGEFTTQATTTVLGGKPVDTKHTGTATRKWVLNNRFVEETGRNAAGEEIRVIFTYDVYRKSYRWFYMNSSGINLVMDGQWDEATKTFAYRADLGNGLTQVATMKFGDDDTQTWSSKVTDAAGKVLYEGGGTVTRKK